MPTKPIWREAGAQGTRDEETSNLSWAAAHELSVQGRRGGLKGKICTKDSGKGVVLPRTGRLRRVREKKGTCSSCGASSRTGSGGRNLNNRKVSTRRPRLSWEGGIRSVLASFQEGRSRKHTLLKYWARQLSSPLGVAKERISAGKDPSLRDILAHNFEGCARSAIRRKKRIRRTRKEGSSLQGKRRE